MQNALTPPPAKKKPEQLPADVIRQIEQACHGAPIGMRRENCVSDVTYLFQRQAERLKAEEKPKAERQR